MLRQTQLFKNIEGFSLRVVESQPDLLNTQPHGHVETGESANIRNESFVKGLQATFVDGDFDDVERTLVPGRLVHLSCRKHIERRTENAGGKTGTGGAHHLTRNIVFHEAPANDSLFIMIVTGNLCGANYTVAYNVS